MAKSEMDEFKKVLRSLLISAKEGLSLRAIETDYQETVFEPLPYKKLMFENSRSLIAACSDVARTSDGYTYHGIADSTTAHIAKMVSKQKGKKNRSSAGGFTRVTPGIKFKGSSLGNKYRSGGNHQYSVHRHPAPAHLQHHIPRMRPLPVAMPRFSLPPRPRLQPPVNPFMGVPLRQCPAPVNSKPPTYGSESIALPIPVLKKQLSDLLAGSKAGLLEGDLLASYERRYGKKLNLRANHFTDVNTMVDVMLRHRVAIVSPFSKPPHRRIYCNEQHLYLNEPETKYISTTANGTSNTGSNLPSNNGSKLPSNIASNSSSSASSSLPSNVGSRTGSSLPSRPGSSLPSNPRSTVPSMPGFNLPSRPGSSLPSNPCSTVPSMPGSSLPSRPTSVAPVAVVPAPIPPPPAYTTPTTTAVPNPASSSPTCSTNIIRPLMPRHMVRANVHSLGVTTPRMQKPASVDPNMGMYGDVTTSLADKIADVTLTGDEEKERADAEKLRSQLSQIVDQFKYGLKLSHLPGEYLKKYGHPLPKIGTSNLRSIITNMTDSSGGSFYGIINSDGEIVIRSLSYFITTEMELTISNKLLSINCKPTPNRLFSVFEIGKLIVRITDKYPQGIDFYSLQTKFLEYENELSSGLDLLMFQSQQSFEKIMDIYVDVSFEGNTAIFKPKDYKKYSQNDNLEVPRHKIVYVNGYQDFTQFDEFKRKENKSRLVSYMNVKLEFIASAVEFYVSMENQQLNKLTLCKSLDKFYSSMAFTKVIGDADLTIGMTLVADSGNDNNRWRRAVVLKLLKGDDEIVNTRTKVEVIYIDYGERAIIRKQNLKYLQKEFYESPAFAVKCELSGCKLLPMNGNSCDILKEASVKQVHMVILNTETKVLQVDLIGIFNKVVYRYSDCLYEMKIISRNNNVYKCNAEGPIIPSRVRRYGMKGSFFTLIRWNHDLYAISDEIIKIMCPEASSFSKIAKEKGFRYEPSKIVDNHTSYVIASMLIAKNKYLEICNESFSVNVVDIKTIIRFTDHFSNLANLKNTLKDIYSAFDPNINCWKLADAVQNKTFSRSVDINESFMKKLAFSFDEVRKYNLAKCIGDEHNDDDDEILQVMHDMDVDIKLTYDKINKKIYNSIGFSNTGKKIYDNMLQNPASDVADINSSDVETRGYNEQQAVNFNHRNPQLQQRSQ